MGRKITPYTFERLLESLQNKNSQRYKDLESRLLGEDPAYILHKKGYFLQGKEERSLADFINSNSVPKDRIVDILNIWTSKKGSYLYILLRELSNDERKKLLDALKNLEFSQIRELHFKIASYGWIRCGYVRLLGQPIPEIHKGYLESYKDFGQVYSYWMRWLIQNCPIEELWKLLVEIQDGGSGRDLKYLYPSLCLAFSEDRFAFWEHFLERDKNLLEQAIRKENGLNPFELFAPFPWSNSTEAAIPAEERKISNNNNNQSIKASSGIVDETWNVKTWKLGLDWLEEKKLLKLVFPRLKCERFHDEFKKLPNVVWLLGYAGLDINRLWLTKLLETKDFVLIKSVLLERILGHLPAIYCKDSQFMDQLFLWLFNYPLEIVTDVLEEHFLTLVYGMSEEISFNMTNLILDKLPQKQVLRLLKVKKDTDIENGLAVSLAHFFGRHVVKLSQLILNWLLEKSGLRDKQIISVLNSKIPDINIKFLAYLASNSTLSSNQLWMNWLIKKAPPEQVLEMVSEFLEAMFFEEGFFEEGHEKLFIDLIHCICQVDIRANGLESYIKVLKNIISYKFINRIENSDTVDEILKPCLENSLEKLSSDGDQFSKFFKELGDLNPREPSSRPRSVLFTLLNKASLENNKLWLTKLLATNNFDLICSVLFDIKPGGYFLASHFLYQDDSLIEDWFSWLLNQDFDQVISVLEKKGGRGFTKIKFLIMRSKPKDALHMMEIMLEKLTSEQRLRFLKLKNNNNIEDVEGHNLLQNFLRKGVSSESDKLNELILNWLFKDSKLSKNDIIKILNFKCSDYSSEKLLQLFTSCLTLNNNKLLFKWLLTTEIPPEMIIDNAPYLLYLLQEKGDHGDIINAIIEYLLDHEEAIEASHMIDFFWWLSIKSDLYKKAEPMLGREIILLPMNDFSKLQDCMGRIKKGENLVIVQHDDLCEKWFIHANNYSKPYFCEPIFLELVQAQGFLFDPSDRRMLLAFYDIRTRDSKLFFEFFQLMVKRLYAYSPSEIIKRVREFSIFIYQNDLNKINEMGKIFLENGIGNAFDFLGKHLIHDFLSGVNYGCEMPAVYEWVIKNINNVPIGGLEKLALYSGQSFFLQTKNLIAKIQKLFLSKVNNNNNNDKNIDEKINKEVVMKRLNSIIDFLKEKYEFIQNFDDECKKRRIELERKEFLFYSFSKIPVYILDFLEKYSEKMLNDKKEESYEKMMKLCEEITKLCEEVRNGCYERILECKTQLLEGDQYAEIALFCRLKTDQELNDSEKDSQDVKVFLKTQNGKFFYEFYKRATKKGAYEQICQPAYDILNREFFNNNNSNDPGELNRLRKELKQEKEKNERISKELERKNEENKRISKELEQTKKELKELEEKNKNLETLKKIKLEELETEQHPKDEKDKYGPKFF